MHTSAIFVLVSLELSKARAKFPSNRHLLHAFTEEAGEVTKAFLDSNQGKADEVQIIRELIQTIAMAVRLLQESDPDFPVLKPMPEFSKIPDSDLD